MKQPRSKHKYVPIGYKLMLTYIFFIIIPVSVIGFVSHSMYNDSLREHTSSNIKGTLLQIRDNIDYKMGKLSGYQHSYIVIMISIGICEAMKKAGRIMTGCL